ncbi:MAG: patatin-like phospholipase family protein [Salinivirgaceae bacterium]|nr:patatin-like phospholipase family protein [Salinivirgaceae bacterium]
MSLIKFTLLLFIIAFAFKNQAQSVGLVLSGGGAKGFAHVGVIKALEENNIPIDYIAGTSIGAIVGGLYSIGFSPDEMKELLKSEEFLSWSYGYIDIEDEYYYMLKNEMPGWTEFSLKKENGIYKPELPTNIISPEQMDLRFIQFFEPAGSGVGYDFNKLMVPFFCVATDVHKNKPLVLNSGNLSTAIRASMTFPGYFKPIEIDSVLLFDGGMENNFPVDDMIERFNPDILIGSKVAYNPKKPDPNDLYRQLENVFMKNTNYKMPENGILIEPEVKDYGLLDFAKFDSLYLRGYEATIEKLDSIKQIISRKVTKEEVTEKRSIFKQNKKELVIENIYITGVNAQTVDYIMNNIKRNRQTITFNEFEQEYFKLLSDKLIQSIYPRLLFNEHSGFFDCYLDIQIKNEFTVSLGGNISSNLRNLGYAELDYIFQKKNVYNLTTNFMLGQFYNSFMGKFRMDFPPRNMNGNRVLTPFFIDISATNNSWDYFKVTSDWFVDSESPSQVKQKEVHFQSNFGRPINNRGLFYSGFAYGQTDDQYFHTNLIERSAIPDQTIFDYSTIHLTYEYSTLNFKEYATKGKYFKLQGRYVTGLESYNPGTTTEITNPQSYSNGHSWMHIHGDFQKYFETSKHFTFGFKTNILYSTKNEYNNSMSTLLSAYAFHPFPQSKLFLHKYFRANSYATAGIIPIVVINETLSLRTELFAFQPYQYIRINDYNTSFSKNFEAPSLAAMAAAVYQSPIGPLALTACYFMNEETSFYFQVNFGYILFNKRGIY